MSFFDAIKRRLAFSAVAVLVVGATGCQTARSPGTLGGDWVLVELGGEPVELAEAERAPSISFDDGASRAEGFAGCNNFFSSYTVDGSSLTFGPVGSTRMACPGVEDDIEARFLGALRHTKAWRIKGGKLHLLGADMTLARFEAAPASESP